MKIVSVSDINAHIASDAQGYIAECEKKYSERIKRVAEGIRDTSTERPIILLSGPSGSGKTTSALRLEQLLDGWGCETHTIAMDEYFYHCEENQILDENGNVDYESPYRVDIKLLGEHLERIANCEPVNIPKFDFITQKRVASERVLHRKKGELVILEGIHALNPLVTGRALEYSNGIYVSVRTRIETEKGEVIHPSRIRLMRRLIRDKLYRGRDFISSLEMYNSVERGENLYIMPHKNNARFSIDSFIGYEPAVYKKHILGDFCTLDKVYPRYEEFADVERLLTECAEISDDMIPVSSLLREFVGGGTFQY